MSLKQLLAKVGKAKLLVILIGMLTCLLTSQKTYAQPCDTATPTFTIDLTGDPDSTWTSPSVARAGLCCTFANPFNCIEFNLTLDPGSEGIRIDIISGALPGGSLFYQFSCGDTGFIGDDICLSGVGPHRITFCKPGNNQNVYTITAIAKPSISGDIVVSDACVDSIYATGLVESSIKWRSVPNNVTYDAFLSCDTMCDSVIVVPTGSPLPDFVDYEVCGTVIGGCAQLKFCDTTRVFLVTTTGVDIQPDTPTICFGETTTDITAVPIGGKAPFSYLWSTNDTAQVIAVDTGTYWVQMTDSLGCVISTDTVRVTEFTNPILSLPVDTTMCRNVTSTGIRGTVQEATGGVWSGGNGTFSDSTSLTTIYTPTAAEISSGSVTLYLTTTGNGTCPAEVDSMTLTFTDPPNTVINGPDSVCEYDIQNYFISKINGNSALWSVTGGTIVGNNNAAIVNISWGAAGVGNLQVIHTDSFGCDSLVILPVTILPKPTPLIAGDDTACEYQTYTYSTPNNAGNTYAWTVIGGTIIGPANTNTINVKWAATGSGAVSVTETNALNCDSAAEQIDVVVVPTPTPLITGNSTVCEYKAYTYSTNVNDPANTYQWIVSGGTIVGSSTEDSVTVVWNATGTGSISVTETNIFNCDSSNSIASIVINPTPVPLISGDDTTCEYQTYAYATTFVSGNTYQWAVSGGTIVGSSTSSSVSVRWDATGTGSIQVTETNPDNCDSTISIPGVVIQPTPVPVLSGPDSTCEYQAYVYSTPLVGGDTYQWIVSGGTILGSSTSNSVTVSWGTTGTGSIQVTQTNPEGCDSTVSIPGVVIMPKPVPVIAGADSVCEYQDYVYSTTNNAGNTYQWIVSGGTILGSSTSNSVTVSWSTTGTGSIQVTETSPFGCDSLVINPGIVIMPKPVPVISGSDSVCEYQDYVYSTPNNAGNIYQWVVSGGTILGSSTSNSVTVSWSTTGTGSIQVTETSPFGCDSLVINPGIIIMPKPVPVLSGSDSVCEYQNYVYSTPNNVGNTYQWIVSGGTILGSSTTNSITVKWDANGTGSVQVTESSAFGCDSIVSIPGVVILPTPVPVLSGSDTTCEYQTYTYSTPFVAGDTYVWAVSGGSIIGASTGNSINVKWDATGTGSVQVTQTNPEGCDSSVAITGIVIQPTPVPVISGSDTVCEYQAYVYSTPLSGTDTYQWVVSGGNILGSSTSNSVTISWSTTGTGSLTLTQSNAAGCDSTVSLTGIVIQPKPVPLITGDDTTCEFQSFAYATALVGGDSYKWSVTNGTISGSDSGNTVTVVWGATGAGTLTVIQTNPEGCDSSITIPIIIHAVPQPVISGADTACEYRTVTYSTPLVVSDTYLWVVSGGTIVGSNTGNSIDVFWGATGSGNVAVTQTNAEGCDSTVSVSSGVVIQPTPVPVLSGADTTCEYQTYTYTTPFVAADTYAWSISGGVIVGASTGNSVNVKWDATGTGSVQVTQTNPEGCDSIVAITGIVIQPTPVPVLSGSDTVCEYQTYTYSTPNVAGDAYAWVVNGGQIVGATNANSINVRWDGTGLGNGSVQVTQTNPEGCDSIVAITGIVIQPTPVPVLSGADTTCEYQTYTYTTPFVAADTYAWSISGGVIVGVSTGNSVNVKWDATGTGSVQVTQTNPEGCDSIVAITGIVIQPTPVPVLSGSDTVCEYQTYTYSTPFVAADTYVWAISGGTIVGASTGNSVDVKWDATGTGSVQVTQTNPEGCDSTVAITGILIQPTPVPVLSGADTTCEYQTYTYTTPFVAADTYVWAISGGTIVGASTGNSVNVKWDATGTGSVQVTQTNPEGCDSTVAITGIVIQPTPVPVLSGSDTVCEYQTYTYSTPFVAADTYVWAISGGTIVGASTGNSVNVKWDATGTGSVQVTQTNPEGCDSTVAITGIVIQPTPVPVISGLDSVCEYQAYNYSTPNNAGNTYLWVVSGGTILGSSTNNSVTISWSTTGIGTLTVTETNPEGCDSTVSLNGIVILPKPVPVLTGADTTCEYQTYTYSTPFVAGDTYVWAISGGTIVGASTGNSVDVKWDATGTGSVQVNQSSPEGCDSIVAITGIVIQPTPVPVLSGSDTVCEYQTYTYSTPFVATDNYAWVVNGGQIVGATNTNSINVRWDGTGLGNGSVQVTQTNPEGCDSTVAITGIVIQPTPVPVLTGADTTCEYQTYTYTTPFVAADTYVWAISGGTIVGASTGNSVNVKWDATGTGSVQVTQTNPEGCDSTVAITGIVIQPTPVPVLSGSDTVCEYQTYVYATPNVIGDNYVWVVNGGQIVGATNTNSISVRWDGTGLGNGSVQVTQTNPEGCDSTVAINGIVIQPTPVPIVSGPDTVCAFKIETYSTPLVGSDTYQWAVVGGSILGSSTNNSVNIEWAGNGIGTISVTQTNPFGCDSTASISIIQIDSTPLPLIVGPDTLCEFTTQNYSVDSFVTHTYQWSVTGGTILGATTNSSVTVNWGATGAGTLTIAETNIFDCDSILTINIQIQPVPEPVISGPDTACSYRTTSYSTPNVPGDSYLWTVTGGFVVGDSTNNSVDIRWGAAGTGSVSVTQTNPEGCDTTVTQSGIVINPSPEPLLTGSDTTCEYQTYTYSTPNVIGDTYAWVVSGGTIVGASTGNSINVKWGATGAGSVQVTETSPEGCDSTVAITGILIQPTPVPVLSGSDTVCEYQTYTYSTPNVAGDSYAWVVNGGQIVGATNTNSINIRWDGTGLGNGSVQVIQTNPEGCDSTVAITGIVIQPTPVPVLSGPDSVCEYQAFTYSTPFVAGDSYAWTVSGGTIIGSSTGNSISVNWGVNGVIGMVQVVQTNPEGCDSTVIKDVIIINPTPVPVLSGPDTTCEYQTYTYSTPHVPGDTYDWVISGGAIVGVNDSSTINVKWDATGTGSVQVTQTNPQGCDSVVSIPAITIHPTPVPLITGPDTVCEFKVIQYSTPNVGADSYVWNISGGTIIGSNTSNDVYVLWGSVGTGTLSVTQTNPFGCDSTISIPVVQIDSTPVPVIVGPDSVCEFKIFTYSVDSVGDDTYKWTVNGGAILGADSLPTVNIRWDGLGTGDVTIVQTNRYGCDSTVSIPGIIIQPTPVPIITGADTTCEYRTYTYSTPNVAGNTYQWVVNGGFIVGSSTNNTVDVRWQATGNGFISVTETNPEGCDSTVTSTDSIVIQPSPVPVLAGSDTVCEYQTYTYSTPNVVGDTYVWAISGGNIVGASTGNSVNVKWDATGTGSVQVTQTNPEGCDSTVAITGIVIQPTPVPVLSGSDTVCEYQTYTYATPNVAGDSYAWVVNGGQIVGATNTNSINVRWDGTGLGNGSVQVTQTNPEGCDSTVAITGIVIQPTPTPLVSGPDTVCEYKIIQYTTANVAGDTYQWAVTGGTIQGSSTGNNVYILWGTAGSGSLQVTQTNPEGCDSTFALPFIQIDSTPVPVMVGPDSVCEYKMNTYAVDSVGNDTYKWTVDGGVIVGADSLHIVTIRWDSAGFLATVTVVQTNAYGCDSTVSISNIVINETPVPVVAGPDSVCEFKVETYGIFNYQLGNTYSWSIQGGTFIGPTDGPQVSVLWDSTSVNTGFIFITETNPEGCDSTVGYASVTILPTPEPAITGPDTVCEYKTYTYSTDSASNNTFSWSVTGGTIIGSTTDTFINVKWSGTGLGSVQVLQTNEFGCDSTIVLQGILINPTPTPVIAGNDSVCEYRTTSYSVTAIAGNQYAWTATGGAILGDTSLNTIDVRWGATGIGSVNVIQTNPQGCDSAISKTNIIISPTPVPVIAGSDSVCEYKYVTYTTPRVANHTYSWSTTGGTIIGSNTDTIVNIYWGVAGFGTVTVTETNEFNCDSTVSMDDILISITPKPLIIGPDNGCEYEHSIYSVPEVPNNTYVWSITGGTIVGSNTNDSIIVLWGSTGTGTISIQETSPLGCDSTIAKTNIIINPTPVPIIDGLDSACAFRDQTYTTPLNGTNTYLWNIVGGTILGPNNQNMVTVRWAGPGSAEVRVIETNPQGCDSFDLMAVDIVPSPTPVIVGQDPVCAFRQYNYSVTNLPANTYSWGVIGGSIIGKSDSNVVRILWGDEGPGTLFVNMTNEFGCDSSISKSLTIQRTPIPEIFGSINDCENEQRSYFVNAIPGHTYQWNIIGGTILSGVNSTQVLVEWGSAGIGTLIVTQTTQQGCDSTLSLDITLNPKPKPVITGPISGCAFGPSIYNINSSPGDIIQWKLPGAGGLIIDGQGTDELTVRWQNNNNATVWVRLTNVHGCVDSTFEDIQINPTPTPEVIGEDSVCVGVTEKYDVNPIIGGNTYLWAVTGGTIIGSNIGTNVDVLWSTQGTGSVSVTESTVLGCDSTYTLAVIVSPKPAPKISGKPVGCKGDLNVPYKYGAAGIADRSYFWNVSSGGVISGGQNTKDVSINWLGPGTHTITLTETNLLTGCDSTVSTTIQVDSVPTAIANISPDQACVPTAIEFDFDGPNNSTLTFKWIFEDGTPETRRSFFKSYYTATNEKVRLVVTDPSTTCADTSVENTIFLWPQPTAKFTHDKVGDTIYGNEDDIQFTDLSTSQYTINKWDWTFGDGTGSADQHPNHKFIEEGELLITLIIEDIHKCKDTAFMRVNTRIRPIMYAPNAFSPDGDNINDSYRISTFNISPDGFNVAIYNRWGERLFESTNKDFEWNGMYMGEIVENEVYIVVITARSVTGIPLKFKSTVTVLR